MSKLYRALDALMSTDVYKLEHRLMYPPGTQVLFSNLTARSTRIPDVDATVFFGMQAFLHQLQELWEPFFALSEVGELTRVLELFRDEISLVLDVDRKDIPIGHFAHLHKLGHLPLRIKALREGALVPLGVPYLTMENTHEDFAWFTGYIETILLASMWMPITNATVAWRSRQLLNARAQVSSDVSAVDLQGHDFSCRGMEGLPAAAVSSAAHLVSYRGGDTLPTLRYVRDYYGGDNGVVMRSCPATEHSVMCAGGEDGEFETFERLIDAYPRGALSIVSDTWNLWRVLQDYLPRLKDKIMARDGRLVIRPDSGVPELIVCGDPNAPEGTPERKGAIRLLDEVFGGAVNQMGYRELDPHIGLIYGDSITYERAATITDTLMSQGYASTVLTLGFGAFTYQYQTRDTFGMAVKSTWGKIKGEPRNLFKNPITDTGKRSATGRLAVRTMMNGELYLVEHADAEQEARQRLELVFEDGKIVRHQSFAEVRENLLRETEIYRRRGGNLAV